MHFDPRVGGVKHQEKVLSIDKAEEVQLSEGLGGGRVHNALNFDHLLTVPHLSEFAASVRNSLAAPAGVSRKLLPE